MIKIYKWQFEKKLKYFRKIHIWNGLWFVSLYSAKTEDGTFPLNFHNMVRFILTFVFIPVKVIDWKTQ